MRRAREYTSVYIKGFLVRRFKVPAEAEGHARMLRNWGLDAKVMRELVEVDAGKENEGSV